MISLNYSNDVDHPEDPLNVHKDVVEFKCAWCYLDWWGSPFRLSSGQVRVLVGRADERQLETIYNVVTWIRELYFDARILHLGENKYAIELQYMEDDPADKVFFGLCLIRLLSDEFADPIPRSMSCRQFLSYVFLSHPKNSLHMPLVDGCFAEGGWRSYEKEERPRYGSPLFGYASYAFWTSLKNRAWGKHKIVERLARRSTGILSSEWLTFYSDWLKTEDASLNH